MKGSCAYECLSGGMGCRGNELCERVGYIIVSVNAARFLGQSLTNKTFTIRLITELWRTPLMTPLDKISLAWQYNIKLSMPCLINIVNQGVEDESWFRLWNATK